MYQNIFYLESYVSGLVTQWLIWYDKNHMKTPTITRKNLPESRVKLTIPVTVAQFRPAFEKELEALAKDTRIEGFRQGKAPLPRVLATAGRQRVEAGALDRALNEAYAAALKQENIVPVTQPEITVDSYTAPAEDAADDLQVASFTAELDVLPEVSIKGYDRMKVKAPKVVEVTQKDIDEVFDYLRKQGAKLEDTKEGTAIAKGMWADIGFKGSVDGVAREDMNSAHHPLVVGEGQLIPGFEEEMIGMKKGEEKTFTITFPKDYHAKELQGKKAEFTVTIHEIKDMVMPVVDAEFAKKFGHDTMEQLEKAIRENLEQERKQEQQMKLEEVVVEELLKSAKFDVPHSLVHQEEHRLMEETMKRAGGQPLSEELKKQVGIQAPKNVRIGLALGKVIELENITDKEKPMRLAMDRLIEIATR